MSNRNFNMGKLIRDRNQLIFLIQALGKYWRQSVSESFRFP